MGAAQREREEEEVVKREEKTFLHVSVAKVKALKGYQTAAL